MTESVADAYERLIGECTPQDLEALYTLREERLSKLLKQDAIDVGEVVDMDRLGRFGIA